MLTNSLPDLVSNTGDLATLPTTVIDLLKVLYDPTASAAQVQKILERDPAMTANVLKIANSAFYGVRRDIASVRDALVMLGNRRTATLALATGMAPIMRQDLSGYGLTKEEFWDHSLRAAAASARCAAVLGARALQCEAFTAGLIHDVGKLVLDPVLSQQLKETRGQDEPVMDTSGERKLLGYDHTQAGDLLAEQWGFPEMLVAAVAQHHRDPEGIEGQVVTQAVAAGNQVARAVELDLDDPEQAGLMKRLSDLGISGNDARQLQLDLRDDLGEICGAATCLVTA